MNNGTQTQAQADELAFDDVDINVPSSAPQETIPAGVYTARLVGFKSDVPKPEWRLTGAEGEDTLQYEMTLEITEGEYAGMRFRDYMNRTFHEKATAGKYAAALLGVPTLTPGMVQSTGQLAGKVCQMWIVEKESKKTPGEFRNYIDKLLPLPVARQRPQRPAQDNVASRVSASMRDAERRPVAAGAGNLDDYDEDGGVTF